MRNNKAAFMAATLTLLAGSTAPGIAQTSDPAPYVTPPDMSTAGDPLDQPTPPGCIINADTQFVRLDQSQVKNKRKLRRSKGPGTQSTFDTPFVALKPGSDHWITHCPVYLGTRHVIDHGHACKPVSVLAPSGSYSELRIARGVSGLVFKIQPSALGTLKGKLTPVKNPHGADEEVWLRSSDVTVNGEATGDYEFYVYLQRDGNGFKYYLIEVFVRADEPCRYAHLPGPNTLCRNPDDGSECELPQHDEREDIDVGMIQTQAETGGGHEPIEQK